MITTVSKDELKDEILDITLIDVRDEHAYRFGHIQSARDIPLEKIPDEVTKLFPPEKKNIVVYGEDENQGMEAARKLEEAGYHDIKVYKEGFQEWRRSRLPIKRVDLGDERREHKEG